MGFTGFVLPVDEFVAQRATDLHVLDPMPERDTLGTGMAQVCDLTLTTRNVKDFQCTGVALLGPWEL